MPPISPAFRFFHGNKNAFTPSHQKRQPDSSGIMTLKSFLLNSSVLAAIGLIAATGRAAVIWDEATQGELSGNRTAPTTLTLTLGSNNLLATTQGGDREYAT